MRQDWTEVMREAHSQRAGRSPVAVAGRAGDAAQMQAGVPLEAEERRAEQARGSANGLGPGSLRPRDVFVRARLLTGWCAVQRRQPRRQAVRRRAR